MIELTPLTRDNWRQCAALSVHEAQRDFVPANLYSIAEAQFYPDAHPLAVYNTGGELVGFVLYGRDMSTGHWKLFRLMIDRLFQGRGYGRATLAAVLRRIWQQPDADAVYVRYHVANHAARALYQRAGFIEQGVDGDIATAVMHRELPIRAASV